MDSVFNHNALKILIFSRWVSLNLKVNIFYNSVVTNQILGIFENELEDLYLVNVLDKFCFRGSLSALEEDYFDLKIEIRIPKIKFGIFFVFLEKIDDMVSLH